MTRSTDTGGTRSRTHHWAAPTSFADAGGRSGLEAVFEGEPGEHLLNPMGSVHGGFLATLLDSALGSAVLTTLPPGRAHTTVQLGVHLVRPVFAHGPLLRCEGNVVHAGRTTATAEARVVGAADGKVYAHATTTCAVFALPDAANGARMTV